MTPIALGDSMISAPMVGNEESTPMARGNSTRVTNNNDDADASVEVENSSKALRFYVDNTVPSRHVVTNPKLPDRHEFYNSLCDSNDSTVVPSSVPDSQETCLN
jgi:hypothetical protein